MVSAAEQGKPGECRIFPACKDRGFAQKRVPRSRGKPAGRLGQPFYGWFTCAAKSTEAALAVFPEIEKGR